MSWHSWITYASLPNAKMLIEAKKGQRKSIQSKVILIQRLHSGLKVDKVYAQLSFLEIEIDTYLLIFFWEIMLYFVRGPVFSKKHDGKKII